jgi:hypothetical protein
MKKKQPKKLKLGKIKVADLSNVDLSVLKGGALISFPRPTQFSNCPICDNVGACL